MVASYTFQNLLPAETFGNINLHQLTQFLIKCMTLGLKFLLWKNKKTSKKFHSDIYFQLQ